MAELNAALRLRLIDEVSKTARQVGQSLTATGQAATAASNTSAAASGRARDAHGRFVRATETGADRVAASSKGAAAATTQLETALDGLEAQARQTAAAEGALGGAASGAADDVLDGSKKHARGSKRVQSAAKGQTRGMAEAVNMVTEMSLGLGGLDPRLRELSIGLAMGGNNAVTMAGAMGPIGIVIGVLTGVLPQLITMLSKTGDEMDNVAKKTKTATDRLRELRDQERQRREEQEEDARLRRGEASSAELRDDFRAQQQRLSALQAERREQVAALPRDARAAFERSGTAGLREVAAERRAAVDAAQQAGRTVSAERLREISEIAQASRWIENAAGVERQFRAQMRVARENIPRAEARERVERDQEAAQAASERVSSTRADLASVLTVRGSDLSERQRRRIEQLGASAAEGSLDPRALRRVEDTRLRELLTQLQAQAVQAAQAALAASSSERTLEARLERQRVEVDVRVSDDRVEVTTTDVDAMAPDLTGGQQ